MKIKKELIILAVIVLLLVVYLLFNFNRSGDINYDLPKLTKVSTDEVDKIQFTTPTESITLTRDSKENIWRISPQGYPVLPDKADTMLTQLVDLKIGELISDKQMYEKYELDAQHKITVNAYKGEALVRSLDIGKISDVSNHSFIKVGDNPEIYSVGLNLKTTFDTTGADLRDKNVLEVNRDSVSRIVIEYDGETNTIDKIEVPASENSAAATQWRLNGSEQVAKDSEINTIFNTFSSLTCDNYIEDAAKGDFANPQVKVTFTGDKVYYLQAQAADSENMHVCISSDNDYQFNLMNWKVSSVMKKLEDLLQN